MTVDVIVRYFTQFIETNVFPALLVRRIYSSLRGFLPQMVKIADFGAVSISVRIADVT